jgi:hypothetical protein
MRGGSFLVCAGSNFENQFPEKLAGRPGAPAREKPEIHRNLRGKNRELFTWNREQNQGISI